MRAYFQDESVTIFNASCLDVLPCLADCSVDSVVTDPPYELSNDGKASPNRVLLEMMFPEKAQVYTEPSRSNMLPFLIDQILGLHGVGTIPSPTATVPVSTVTLNSEAARGDEDVEHAGIGSVIAPNSERLSDGEAQTSEHLGDFVFELADASALFDALNGVGCGFFAGGLGVGFGVGASSLPRFLRGSGSVITGDKFIGSGDYALSDLVGTLRGTENQFVARFDLSRGAIDELSTVAALVFFSCLNQGGAKLIRALPTASSLPSVLESRRVCIVSPLTHRTLSLNLIFHTQIISAKGFMGKAWDGSKIAYDVSVWKECLRVLKPGGHLLAFGGTRTSHRMVSAIEDAGFEIRDSLMWVFGSGFPKSLDISKAIDAAAGAERETVSMKRISPTRPEHGRFNDDNYEWKLDVPVTAPATDEAKQWNGWGTALKPAHEPIVLARKPLVGTVAENVLQHGTGGLNVDGCRIEGAKPDTTRGAGGQNGRYGPPNAQGRIVDDGLGRWPANVIHDGSDEVLAGFPETTVGALSGAQNDTRANGQRNGWGLGGWNGDAEYASNSGSAARFFYCAKASKEDREEGLDDLPIRSAGDVTDRKDGSDGLNSPRAGAGRTNGSRNFHPTVKPTDLMRYLVRLVTPYGGTVLDPFAGSGSTGKACVHEGMKAILIEKEAEYCEIAQRRARLAQGRLCFEAIA